MRDSFQTAICSSQNLNLFLNTKKTEDKIRQRLFFFETCLWHACTVIIIHISVLILPIDQFPIFIVLDHIATLTHNKRTIFINE